MSRAIAGSSAIAVLAAWAVCVERYATVGGGSYNSDIFVPLLLLAFGLTAVSGFVAIQAWRGTSSAAVAGIVSALTVVVILLLALAIGLRG